MTLFPSPSQFIAANTAMQGAYIPQYAHIPTSTVPVEVCAFTSLQCDVSELTHLTCLVLSKQFRSDCTVSTVYLG